VQKAVGTLASIVRDSRLNDADVEFGKQAALKNLKQFDELNDEMVMDNLHICAYDASENGGLGLSIKGSEDGINAATSASLKEFKAKHFTAPRMLLVGAGAVKHTELEKFGQQFLGDVADGKKPAPASRYVGGDYRLWNMRMKLAHVAWGFETCGAASGDNVALQLATHIHGSYHRSQHELGQHAMHRVLKMYSSLDHGTPTNTPFPEQAPETVRSFYHAYEDTGLSGMQFVARPWTTGPGWAGSVHDILHYTMTEYSRLAQKCVHQQELDQAKVNMKSQLLFNQDGATNTFQDIGKQVFHFGRRVPLDEMYARIDDITSTNMQEVLQHYYYGRRPVLSCNGYLYIIPGYDNVIHWTYKYWY
jgi:predicted Zn-dependent peptidase